jgi:uncharacterized membrane protein YgcG
MRRALLGGMIVALALLLVPGAWPASARRPAVTFSSPTGKLASSSAPVSGLVRMEGGVVVRDIRVALTALDGQPIPGNPPPIGANNQAEQSFGWGFTFAFNGRVDATVTAWGRDTPIDTNGEESQTGTVQLHIAAPPAKVTGVSATFSESTRQVSLKWNRSPEPDALGYVVYRAPSPGTAAARYSVKDPEVTSLVDEDPLAPGDYRYWVEAVRAAPPDQPIAGGRSNPDSVKVTRPPTTTVGGGTGGGGGGGSVGSGGGSGSSGGSRAGGAVAGPVLATNGRVDMSSFAASLGDRAKLPSVSGGQSSVLSGEEEGTFDENLPYGSTSRTSIVSGEVTLDEVAQAAGEGERSGGTSALLFMAGGLLATVVAMHVLWLKAQVDRMPAMEPAEVTAQE